MNQQPVSPPTSALAAYVAGSQRRDLPPAVVDKALAHVVDTLAAMVSGSELPAGRRGLAYVRPEAGGPGTARVVGDVDGLRFTPVSAALANGMAAHADETDDSHAPSVSHPGCAVVPAALAVAEHTGCTGEAFVRAVVTGYDVGTRVMSAIGIPRRPLEGSRLSTHATAGVFGAAAAAASLLALDEAGARYALSYAGQSAAGTTSWARDVGHVEKAFVFGGMPASNGVRAAAMVASGCDGVADPFSGEPNVLDALADGPADRSRLADGLGERFAVQESAIKKFAVGSPAQPAIQAVLDLVAEHGLTADQVESLEVVLAHDLAEVVDDRDMPNVNIQYLVAGTLLDREFSFAMAHDPARMTAPDVLALRRRTTLVGDTAVTGVRRATVRARTTDGRLLQQDVEAVRGTPGDPMTREEVHTKAVDLCRPVLGDGTERFLELAWGVVGLGDVTELTRAWAPATT